MVTKLSHGDRVTWKSKTGRKMRGTVQDLLPFNRQERVPVLVRTKTHWMDRSDLRKLPCH